MHGSRLGFMIMPSPTRSQTRCSIQSAASTSTLHLPLRQTEGFFGACCGEWRSTLRGAVFRSGRLELVESKDRAQGPLTPQLA